MSEDLSLRCTACTSEDVESVVERGSYNLRCAACGTHVVATSFLAFAESTAKAAAYRDPGHGKPLRPALLIARGPLQEIHAVVAAAAGQGTTVRLVIEE